MNNFGWISPFVVFWKEAPSLGKKLKQDFRNDYRTLYGRMIESILINLRVKKDLYGWRVNFVNQFWNDIFQYELLDPYYIIGSQTEDDIIYYQWKDNIPNEFKAANYSVMMQFYDEAFLSAYIKDCWNNKIDFNNYSYNNDNIWGE